MQIETMQYTETKRLGAFNNHMAYDNVTEYILTASVSYTVEQFEEILKEAHKTVCGMVRFLKKQLTYKSGKVEYMHICQCIEF